MATSYPYVSAQGALIKAFDQFRKAFPATLDAEALQKFGIAPANESYVINTFRFLGLIDDDGKRIEAATEFFYGDDAKFAIGLEKAITKAYQPLVADHGAEAWNETKDSLTTWFRVTDKTSEVVGGRQAQTFLTLSAIAGHGELRPAPAKPGSASSTKARTPKKSGGAAQAPRERPEVKLPETPQTDSSSEFGLTVRIEVNLPATGSPETYDAIFGSIRKHLIDRG